ncbi:hypothetical protein D9M72_596750 [compost metagenome]
MLFLGTKAGQRLRNLLAPAGRMALSNYLAQSLIAALIFHGYGLGLIGQATPLTTVLIALGIYTAQLFISRWWMARFAYGPLEWVLRFITIWRAPQWRKPVGAR